MERVLGSIDSSHTKKIHITLVHNIEFRSYGICTKLWENEKWGQWRKHLEYNIEEPFCLSPNEIISTYFTYLFYRE